MCPQAIHFILIVAVCVVLATLGLVLYVARKINPSSFRLSIALVRMFSFSVEMGSRGSSHDHVETRSRPDAGRPPSP
jgi:hypothetical protein